jgi:putative transposase
VWRQLKREGFDIARCTVARLMRQMGLERTVGEHFKYTMVARSGRQCVGSPEPAQIGDRSGLPVRR